MEVVLLLWCDSRFVGARSFYQCKRGGVLLQRLRYDFWMLQMIHDFPLIFLFVLSVRQNQFHESNNFEYSWKRYLVPLSTCYYGALTFFNVLLQRRPVPQCNKARPTNHKVMPFLLMHLPYDTDVAVTNNEVPVFHLLEGIMLLSLQQAQLLWNLTAEEESPLYDRWWQQRDFTWYDHLSSRGRTHEWPRLKNSLGGYGEKYNCPTIDPSHHDSVSAFALTYGWTNIYEDINMEIIVIWSTTITTSPSGMSHMIDLQSKHRVSFVLANNDWREQIWFLLSQTFETAPSADESTISDDPLVRWYELAISQCTGKPLHVNIPDLDTQDASTIPRSLKITVWPASHIYWSVYDLIPI